MSSTAINPRKRTATTTTTTTTDTVGTMMNGSSSTVAKNQLNVAAKRNKFENTPVISSLVQQTEYTVLDVQRLLHVMETTTPSESSSSSSTTTTTTNNNNDDDTTHSWKDYEIRAQLLQDMYTNVYNKTQATVTSTATTNGSKKHKQQHQNSLQLLEELHPRIQTILQVTKDYIITLKEQQQRNNNTTDPFDKLFPPPVTSTIPTMKTTVAATKKTSTKTTTTTTPSVSSNSDSVTVTVPPPKVSHQKKTPATSTKNNSSTMVEIQQQQREQMEMAVSQMAEQLKLQTKSMNEQIQQQNNQMIDELHTTMEQNVQDVTKVTQLTQQQITNTSRRSYSKWTMIILMAITFVMTLLFILTIPKPRNHHPIYTKYIHEPSSNGVHKNTKTNNETTHICRLLPSGVEECYYIPETTNVVVKEESNDTPIIHDIQQQEQQEPQQNDVLDDHNVPDQQQQQQHEVLPEEQNVHDPHQKNQVQEEETMEHITTVGQEDNTVNTAAVTQDVVVNDNVVIDSNDNNNNMEQDMDQLYIALRHSAVNEVNIPVMKQYIQTHPSLLYYTDTNGWSLLHELARSSSSSSSSSTTTSTNTLQDRIEMIQYIIEQNETLIHLTTHLGLTPYDLAMNNINSMNHEQQEQYQTIVTLLHPPTPDLSETIPIDEGVTGSVESSGTDELDRTVSEEVPESLSSPDMIVDATIASTEEVEAEVPVVEAEIVMDQISDGANTQVEQDTETVVPEEEEEETFVEGLSIFELAKHAIAFNEIDLFRTYVEEYPSLLYDVDEEDNGMSLLHFAVRYKNAYNIVQYLLETSLSAMENEEEDEEGYHIPIWTIATYGRVNEETGIVEVPPQTPYDLALELYAVKDPTDPEHPSLQLLREVVMTEHDEFFMEDDEEVDEYNSGDDEMECDIDVTTGLCRQTDTIQQDTEVDGIDSLLQIPDDSGDILEDALRDFEEMKRG